MDWNSQKNWERREGREEGRKEGIVEMSDLIKWLFDNDRGDEVRRVVSEPEYMNKVMKEYKDLQISLEQSEITDDEKSKDIVKA